MKQRLEYVDIWRGIAVLIMIFIQLFDFFSRKSIYTDAPWYTPQINSVTWVPPVWLFAFVVGISVLLLIEKLGDKAGLKEVAKRYLPYVLISLPFTVIMWDLSVWIGWEEAIQGLGLTAVFAAAILLSKPSNKRLLYLVFGFSLLHVMLNSFVSIETNVAASIIINALWKGWFSITNLLPFMLAGVVFFRLTRENKSKAKIALFAGVFVAAAVILHLSGFAIDFYNRSFGHFLFGIGQSALIAVAVVVLWQYLPGKGWRFFSTFGKAAFAVYIGHYLFIGKVSEIVGLRDTLPDSIAILLAILSVIVVYLGAEVWLQYRHKFQGKNFLKSG